MFKKMDEKSMRENIARAREKKNFTKKAIAESLGISRIAYSAIENGPTRILNPNIEQIAEVLEVSLGELLLGYEPDPDSAGLLMAEREEYGKRREMLVGRYEEKLSAGDRENEALRALIESQKQTILSQEKIIAMLRRRIPEEND